MNVLAFDPGATRAGWAVLGSPGSDGKPVYIASGVVHCPRLKQPFQKYRMELTELWTDLSHELIEDYKPQVMVNEIVPSRGAGINEQLYLANVMITVVHTTALVYGVKIVQISARKIQAAIAKRKKGVKITKTQVRNGVLEILPELKPRLPEFIKVFEETDALAAGINWLSL